MTVTDVEIDHARPARSPDTRAALAYLTASGATAITITEVDGVCTFHVGSKIDPRASVQWLPEANARAVMLKGRRVAGARPDAETAMRALIQAAADQRVTLTPHDVAISRATNAAAKLDRYLDSLQGSGVLREFTRMYKRRRIEAKAAGQGFMTYKNAELRLRRALVPLLVSGQGVGPMQSLFAQIFDR
jgi:hypothetical protein